MTRFALAASTLLLAGCGNDVTATVNTSQPPAVAFVTPAPGEVVQSGTVEVLTTAEDDLDATEDLILTLSRVDGESLPTRIVDSELDVVRWEVSEVTPGALTLRLSAIDGDGNESTSELTFTAASDGDGDGYLDAENGGTDCDDTRSEAYPEAEELCNDLNDDCDDDTDEGVENVTWSHDADGDGYGNPADQVTDCAAPSDSWVENAEDCDDEDASVNPDTVWYADDDADSFGAEADTTTSCEQPSGYVATAGDCDDSDASIHPDAEEVCNDIDDDCDTLVDDDDDTVAPDATWYADADSDGFGDAEASTVSCAAPSGYADDADDCDDTDPAVNPDAVEVCDALDNDCDTLVDDDDDGVDLSTGTVFYQDGDGDGYGDEDLDQRFCAEPSGWSSLDTDCDDGDASISPVGSEICNEADDDCDGLVDIEDDSLDLTTVSTVYADADGDGYGDTDDAGTSACSVEVGYAATSDDCDDADADVHPDATEVCNDGVDDDCDGLADADDDSLDTSTNVTWYADTDGDGYGDADVTLASCDQPSGYLADDTDCDDGDGTIHPDAEELCDGVDNDCDTETDEDDASDATTWYADTDGDGYGDADASLTACDQPSGYEDDAEDCDDTNGEVNPAATEVCDDQDNDCDTETDEDDASDAATWYADADGDGYGVDSDNLVSCDQPSGYESAGGDCNDDATAVNPDATEVCDDIDNDCDELIDDADDDLDTSSGTTWYADTDGDGYGDASSSTEACVQPSGYTDDTDDCDDSDLGVNPDATEVCNDGVDDDCDGLSDEDDDGLSDATTWYEDADGDGYGDGDFFTEACEMPSGYVATDGDCDDADASVSTIGDEVCDDLDNDCDGLIDDDDSDVTGTSTWYRDADGDGYGDSTDDVDACAAPSGFAGEDGDCDDTTSDVSPDAVEVWYDGVDADCGGDSDYDADADGDDSDSHGGDDCDDSDGSVGPSAVEACDQIDNDCDEIVDEGCFSGGELVVSELHYYSVFNGEIYGEWFELYNTSPDDVPMDGFVLSTAAESFVVAGDAVVVPAAGRVVFCYAHDATSGSWSSDSEGYYATLPSSSCDYEYGSDVNASSSLGATYEDGFTLRNPCSASYDTTLSVAVAETTLDSVEWDNLNCDAGASFPALDSTTTAMSLSIELQDGQLDASSNDVGSNWCLTEEADATKYASGGYREHGTPQAAEGCP